ncbi:uncharacterized protein LOC127855870 isoform X1 [Dreissena polymorpha]|uniref:uncharacterized protein LOC127855870 isoform X1 n=1 Tax=Dreissena polymorpha TaxID=45954 RepID=UPI00226449FF|nr:uncharacterized protein LOC127855870 isoform X1 [Dreissena polymorpha]
MDYNIDTMSSSPPNDISSRGQRTGTHANAASLANTSETQVTVDLAYEKTNRVYKLAIRQMWSLLSGMSGTQLNAQAYTFVTDGMVLLQFAFNSACNLHVASMLREFESVVTLLWQPVDQRAPRIELDREIYELQRVKTIGQTYLQERDTFSQSADIVRARVENILRKMEVIRNAFSCTLQAYRRRQ